MVQHLTCPVCMVENTTITLPPVQFWEFPPVNNLYTLQFTLPLIRSGIRAAREVDDLASV